MAPAPTSARQLSPALMPTELTPGEFEAVCTLAYQVFGLNLREGKEGLVRARVARRLRALDLATVSEYLDYVRADTSGAELKQLVDVLTTNKTSFFREAQHFTFLRERVLPGLPAAGRSIRVWSAGCSTGEEPVSLAIALLQDLSAAALRDARILATDISTRVLDRARGGLYEADAMQAVPPVLARTYFEPVRDHVPRVWRPRAPVRALIRYARLNLMDTWPMHGPFDVILCRNVMIYFDRPTQERLVARFWELLAPGGHLFVGHAESMSALRHSFVFVAPAVYQKSQTTTARP